MTQDKRLADRLRKRLGLTREQATDSEILARTSGTYLRADTVLVLALGDLGLAARKAMAEIPRFFKRRK